MNTRRKILTILALIVFGIIIALHYISYEMLYGPPPYSYHTPVIENVGLPLFALAVFYIGLFSMLGGQKPKTKPQFKTRLVPRFKPEQSVNADGWWSPATGPPPLSPEEQAAAQGGVGGIFGTSRR